MNGIDRLLLGVKSSYEVGSQMCDFVSKKKIKKIPYRENKNLLFRLVWTV